MNTTIPTKKQLQKELCTVYSKTFNIIGHWPFEQEADFVVRFPTPFPFSSVCVYVSLNNDGTFILSDRGEARIDKNNMAALTLLRVYKDCGVKESESERPSLTLTSSREDLAWKIYHFSNLLATLWCMRFPIKENLS